MAMTVVEGPATVTARSLVEGFVAAGVRHVVLCPGSRSAPLAYAAHSADAAGVLRLHVRIDERSAAFTALGIARVSGVPVVVVTTSGTAVANLWPALLEAHHSRVPLVALTADRPARLRGTWANQTSDLQAGIFGAAVAWSADIEATVDPVAGRASAEASVAASLGHAGPRSGPVHLNIGFDDPLVPAELTWRPDGVRRSWSDTTTTPPDVVLAQGPRTVVVAGDGAAAGAARRLAETAGWPLFAEPSSGSRGGVNLIAAYRLLLDDDLADGVQRAVVFGRPTLSRPVAALLARPDVELVVVGPAAEAGPGRPATRVSGPVTVTGAIDSAWLAAWHEAGRVAAEAIDEVLTDERRRVDGLSGYDVAHAVVASTGPDTGIVFAASNPIRDADLAAGAVEARFTLANRGLSGIDGTVSTAAGASLASGDGSRSGGVRVLVGDLAFLHDTNALLLGAGEPRPRVQVVVVNDGGGGIFGLLEHGEERFSTVLDRVFATPQQVDLAALCTAHGVPHQRITGLDDLWAALAGPVADGITVVEVRIQRGRQRDLAERLRLAVHPPKF